MFSFVLQASLAAPIQHLPHPAAAAVIQAAHLKRSHLLLQDSAQGLVLVVDLRGVIDLPILGDLPKLEELVSSNHSEHGSKPPLPCTAKRK